MCRDTRGAPLTKIRVTHGEGCTGLPSPEHDRALALLSHHEQ